MKVKTMKRGRPTLPKSHIKYIRMLRKEGYSVRMINQITDISTSAIVKYT